MSIDSEREYSHAAIKRAGDAIEIATQTIVLADKIYTDTCLTYDELSALGDAYAWASDRQLLP